MDRLNLAMPLPGGMSGDLRGVEKTMWSVNKLLSGRQDEDYASFEAFMNSLMGTIPEYEPKTPLEKAQSIAYDAYAAKGSKKRVRLARKALEASPDCADAYVILAEETAETPEAACPIYEQGIAAGERALGALLKDPEAVGTLWDNIDARPYLRTKLGFADALWAMGERQRAVEQARDLLRLDLDDHQGVRYWLMSWLVILGHDSEARQLLRDYEERDGTEWAYTLALITFREKGASGLARRRLQDALRANPLVPMIFGGLAANEAEFIESVRNLPDEIMFAFGEQARSYVISSAEGWATTEGAFDWMMTVFEKGPDEMRTPPKLDMRLGKRRKR